jgi:predicted ATPase
MITDLRAQNFKSWKDTGDLRLAPLTGLFGTNSSGKSSILQVLLMMKQTAESSDQVLRLGGGPQPDVDLGTFASLIHGHEPTKELGISLVWRLDNKYLPANHDPVRLDVSIREDRERIVVSKFTFTTITENRAGMELNADGGYTSFENDVKRPSKAPPKFYRFPPDQISPLGWTLSGEFEQMLQDLIYLGPFRVSAPRADLFRGTRPRDVGKDGAEAIQALLAVREADPSVQRRVAEYLERMKLLDSFELRAIAPDRRYFEVVVKVTKESPEVSLADVGSGVSQVLPVLVLCAYAEEGSTLLIEEPEMHLHPSAQSELADVIVDAVKDRNLQIILESHSEHFLRRLQLRIAKDEFAAKKAALYFCHMENGESKADPLRLTDDGYIKNWPPDFFGNEMGDIVAMTEASIGRRRRAK